MVNNKRGIIRLLEAVMAIMIIATVLLMVLAQRTNQTEKDLTPLLNSLLDEVAKNYDFREGILNNNAGSIEEAKNFLKAELPEERYGLEFKVCDIEEVCSLESFPAGAESLYVAERVISASVSNIGIDPKKMKIFVWRKWKKDLCGCEDYKFIKWKD